MPSGCLSQAPAAELCRLRLKITMIQSLNHTNCSCVVLVALFGMMVVVAQAVVLVTVRLLVSRLLVSLTWRASPARGATSTMCQPARGATVFYNVTVLPGAPLLQELQYCCCCVMAASVGTTSTACRRLCLRCQLVTVCLCPGCEVQVTFGACRPLPAGPVGPILGPTAEVCN
jgi:hypothetical protein